MSVHVLLSAGRGPQECAWALAQLLPRLEAEAAGQGLATRRVQTVPGDRPGTYRSVLVQVSGAGAEAFVATWTGTLCWQAPSPYRASTGRKNWYVIAQLCAVDSPRTTFAEADVDIVACRTGGPGGQHRNKASTAVRATHRPSGIVVVVDTERQLSLNRHLALRLLRQRLERGDEVAGHAVVTAPLAHPRRAGARQSHPHRAPGGKGHKGLTRVDGPKYRCTLIVILIQALT